MITRKVYLIVHVIIAVVVLVPRCVGLKLSVNDMKAFDDSTLFDIDWPGEDLGFVSVASILLTTSRSEKYKCLVPRFKDTGRNLADKYSGPGPYELLRPIFFEVSACSYLWDSYWTYELCHGKHVRQFREDREGKNVQIQQYFLGKWDEDEASNLEKELAKEEEEEGGGGGGGGEPNVRPETPLKKIYGVERRYVQLNMTEGTLCNLTHKPRRTQVIYVCYQYGNQQIYSLKETSTCEYEIIVLSRVLCSHPKYKPQEAREYVISCHSTGNAPKVPKSLVKMDEENFQFRQEGLRNAILISPIDEFKKAVDSKDPLSLEIKSVDNSVEPSTPVAHETGTTPVDDFLSGESCLYGGTGWWKYKFCHGKTVDQYRVELDLRLTVINLGKFIKANHLAWLEQNPNKRPKPVEIRKSISHFYSEGQFCELTGRPRQTEVRIKCMDRISSPSKVGMYLLEPRPCEYILGVESSLVCENVNLADENGLLTVGGSGEEKEDVASLLEKVRLGDEEAEEVVVAE